MKPHKHAELIKAWADGETIQKYFGNGVWAVVTFPQWGENDEYRVARHVKGSTLANIKEPITLILCRGPGGQQLNADWQLGHRSKVELEYVYEGREILTVLHGEAKI